MLIRNNSKITLQTRIKGIMLQIPAGKVVNVDETLISQKQIKDIWGRYITILTEKVEKVGNNESIPTKTEGNLEDTKGEGDIQTSDAGGASEDDKDEDNGSEGDAGDTTGEDSSDDNSDIEQLVNEVLEEIEGKAEESVEEGAEEKPAEKPAPKAAKKPASKKKSTKKK